MSFCCTSVSVSLSVRVSVSVDVSVNARISVCCTAHFLRVCVCVSVGFVGPSALLACLASPLGYLLGNSLKAAATCLIQRSGAKTQNSETGVVVNPKP